MTCRIVRHSISKGDKQEELLAPSKTVEMSHKKTTSDPKITWITEEGPTDPIASHYSLGKRIGREGAYGTVCECTRISDSKQFAVKKINKSDLHRLLEKSPKMHDKYLKHLRSEIEVMRLLKHKYIVSLERVFEDKHHLWIVMERCNGGEVLAKLSKEEKLSELEASRIVKMLLEALNYMHSVHSVVHLDLKLENILFANNGDDNDIIKIIDFGMSQVLPRLERLDFLCGTPYYTAPEVIRKDYGHSADMWSVGTMTFSLLFGFHAFQLKSSPHQTDQSKKKQHKYTYDARFNYNAPVVRGNQLRNNIQMDRKEMERVQRRKKIEERDSVYKSIKRGFDGRIRDGKGAWFPINVPVSDEAYDFMLKLMETDESKRMTAKEALLHPWIVKSNQLSINNDNVNGVTNGDSNDGNSNENACGHCFSGVARFFERIFGKNDKNSQNNNKNTRDCEQVEQRVHCSVSHVPQESKESVESMESMALSDCKEDILNKEEICELICMFSNFAQSTGLKYVVCMLFKETYIATRPVRYAMIQKLFKTFDINNNNKISLNEFTTIMLSLKNVRLDKEQINVVFNEMDVQKCGHIEFNDFLNIAIHDYIVGNDKRMEKIFCKLDKTKAKKINVGDLCLQLKAHLINIDGDLDSNYNKNYVTLLLNELKLSDINKDGYIDEDEFCRALHPKHNVIPPWLWNAKVRVIESLSE